MVEYFICKAFEIVRIFEKGSGTELNVDKTEGMPVRLNGWQERWPSEHKDDIKVLGIFFIKSNGDFQCFNWNFWIEKLLRG